MFVQRPAEQISIAATLSEFRSSPPRQRSQSDLNSEIAYAISKPHVHPHPQNRPPLRRLLTRLRRGFLWRLPGRSAQQPHPRKTPNPTGGGGPPPPPDPG